VLSYRNLISPDIGELIEKLYSTVIQCSVRRRSISSDNIIFRILHNIMPVMWYLIFPPEWKIYNPEILIQKNLCLQGNLDNRTHEHDL
jgi:hypothetical protein